MPLHKKLTKKLVKTTKKAAGIAKKLSRRTPVHGFIKTTKTLRKQTKKARQVLRRRS